MIGYLSPGSRLRRYPTRRGILPSPPRQRQHEHNSKHHSTYVCMKHATRHRSGLSSTICLELTSPARYVCNLTVYTREIAQPRYFFAIKTPKYAQRVASRMGVSLPLFMVSLWFVCPLFLISLCLVRICFAVSAHFHIQYQAFPSER